MQAGYKKIDKYYYDHRSPIGKGAFATVYQAFDTSNEDAPVALKTVPIAALLESEIQRKLFLREIETLRKIKGDHVVKLCDVFQTKTSLYIFLDYCDGGDLSERLKRYGPFEEEEACSIIKQIADVFVTLDTMELSNEKGTKIAMMHRDIKPANIMFHEDQVKLADFGFAKIIDDVAKDVRDGGTLLGSPAYMPPQILNDEDYNYKCDVWSTGVVFYELLTGQLPWKGYSDKDLYRNITTKELSLPKKVSADSIDLIKRMLTVKEEDRISWKEVFNHPALKNIKI
jgi:serine/threonine-protein kinase ULK/ATG1